MTGSVDAAGRVVQCLVLAAVLLLGAEVRHVPLPKVLNPFETDSLFLGASVVVRGSERPVTVTWRGRAGNPGVGELCFMYPGRHDSALFLFHNRISDFPDETTTVSLGTFPAGTELVFRYTSVDTTGENNQMLGVHLYSGQCRDGVDDYVSEAIGLVTGGHRRCVFGEIDDSTCEGGFAAGNDPGEWRGLRFGVHNASMVGVTRFKVPPPLLSPRDSVFADSLQVRVLAPALENTVIRRIGSEYDTTTYVFPVDTATEVRYTTDGTPPSVASPLLLDGHVVLDTTTTLRCCIVLTGDPNWLASNESVCRYELGPTAVVSHAARISRGSHLSAAPLHVSVLQLTGRAVANQLVNSGASEYGPHSRGHSAAGVYVLVPPERQSAAGVRALVLARQMVFCCLRRLPSVRSPSGCGSPWNVLLLSLLQSVSAWSDPEEARATIPSQEQRLHVLPRGRYGPIRNVTPRV